MPSMGHIEFSQKYFSVKLRISQESMARIEKGIIAPKVSRLEDIASTTILTKIP